MSIKEKPNIAAGLSKHLTHTILKGQFLLLNFGQSVTACFGFKAAKQFDLVDQHLDVRADLLVAVFVFVQIKHRATTNVHLSTFA